MIGWVNRGRSGKEAYRQLFRAQLPGVDIEAIREATKKNWALGNERFKQRIEVSDKKKGSSVEIVSEFRLG